VQACCRTLQTRRRTSASLPPFPPRKCQPAVSQVPACRGIPSVLTTRIYGLPRRRTISPRCRRAWLASRRSSGKSMPLCKRRSLPSACLRNGNLSRPRHNIKPTLRKLAHNASVRCRNTCFCPFCMLASATTAQAGPRCLFDPPLSLLHVLAFVFYARRLGDDIGTTSSWQLSLGAVAVTTQCHPVVRWALPVMVSTGSLGQEARALKWVPCLAAVRGPRFFLALVPYWYTRNTRTHAS